MTQICKRKIMIANQRGVYTIPYQEIDYVRQNGRKMIIAMSDGGYVETYDKVPAHFEKEYEDIDGEVFYKVKEYTVVNLSKIISLEDNTIFFEDNELHVGRDAFANLKKVFIKWWNARKYYEKTKGEN